MTRIVTAVAAALAVAACAAAIAGCGSDSGQSGLRDRVTERFAQAGVKLHDASGMFGPGDDIALAPDSRARFGDFVVHLPQNGHGFEIAEASAGPPGADGIRWDDTLATHQPPYFTSFKRYGDALELQWSTERRSVDSPKWRRLDAILRSLR